MCFIYSYSTRNIQNTLQQSIYSNKLQVTREKFVNISTQPPPPRENQSEDSPSGSLPGQYMRKKTFKWFTYSGIYPIYYAERHIRELPL